MSTTDIEEHEEVFVQKELGFDPESPSEGSRIIEFVQNGSEYRVQITNNQRFTFGSLSPGSKYGGLALRIYEGANKDNQLAVFPDVSSVRDISLPVVKIVKSAKGESEFEIGAKGSRSKSTVKRDVEYAPF
jgi:hypothetical protein